MQTQATCVLRPREVAGQEERRVMVKLWGRAGLSTGSSFTSGQWPGLVVILSREWQNLDRVLQCSTARLSTSQSP